MFQDQSNRLFIEEDKVDSPKLKYHKNFKMADNRPQKANEMS